MTQRILFAALLAVIFIGSMVYLAGPDSMFNAPSVPDERGVTLIEPIRPVHFSDSASFEN